MYVILALQHPHGNCIHHAKETVNPSRQGNCKSITSRKLYIHRVKETVCTSISITSSKLYIHHVKKTVQYIHHAKETVCVYRITPRKLYIHHGKELYTVYIMPRKLYIHHGYCPCIFIWTLHIYQGTARTLHRHSICGADTV
jgi:hypothetical protein